MSQVIESGCLKIENYLFLTRRKLSGCNLTYGWAACHSPMLGTKKLEESILPISTN
jgi:hypothetical protein